MQLRDTYPIGIGTFLMGGGFHRETARNTADYSNDDKYISAIKYSLEKGQNHIDTALSYSDGHCDEIVGKAIKGLTREKIFLADKLSKGHMLKNAVLPCIHKSLRVLGVDYIDLYYVHDPNVPEKMEGYIEGINDAIDLGLVKYIGVSNFNLEQLKQAITISKHPIVANQIEFNLIDRTQAAPELLNFCKKNNIIVVAYRPLQNKLYFDGLNHPLIVEIAQKYNKSVSQIGLNWLVKHKQVIAIPKAVEKKHIDENLASLDFEISTEDLNSLDALV